MTAGRTTARADPGRRPLWLLALLSSLCLAVAVAAWISWGRFTAPEVPVPAAVSPATPAAATPAGPPPSLPMPEDEPGTALGSDEAQPPEGRLRFRIEQLPLPLDLTPLPQLALHPQTAGQALRPGPGDTLVFDAATGAAERALERGAWSVALFGAFGPVRTWELELAGATDDRLVPIDAREHGGFSGRVVDSRGEAIAGAALVRGSSGAASATLATHSAPDGSFVLPFLALDQVYELEASSPGFRSARLCELVLPEARCTQLQTLVLAAAPALSGRVVDDGGRAVADCVVKAQVVGPGEPICKTRSDATGRFRFEGLVADQRRVWTESPQAINAALDLAPGETDEITLVLSAGGWIEGLLRVDGQPRAGELAMAIALPRADDRRLGEQLAHPRQARTDAAGRFRLGPLAPGPARVHIPRVGAVRDVVAPIAGLEIDLAGDRNWDVALRFVEATRNEPVTVQGTVDVSWGSPGLEGAGTRVLGRAVTPDNQGSWRLQATSPAGATVALRFEFPGHRPVDIADLAALAVDGGELLVSLQPMAEFTVQVSAGGAALAGAQVDVAWGVPSQVALEAIQSSRTDILRQITAQRFPSLATVVTRLSTGTDGRVRFQPLGSGPLEWIVTAPGHQPALGRLETIDGAAAGPAVEVELLPVAAGR